MYGEGFSSDPYGEEESFQPFDYLAEAERMRKEREAKEATEKAEKEAKEKQKQEDRKARQEAKQAERDAKRLERKADKLGETSKDAKEQVKDVRLQAAEQVKAAVAPTEVIVSTGSEYEANLDNPGEEVTLDIEHDGKKLDESLRAVEDAIDHADEVTDRARAIAEARDALQGVHAEDIGEASAKNETGPIYDLGADNDELRDRVQHAWAGEAQRADTSEITELPSLGSIAAQSGFEAYASNYDTTTGSSYDPGIVERAPDMRSPVTSAVKSGAAFLGGALLGRSRLPKFRSSLDKTRARLTTETDSMKQEIESLKLRIASQTKEHATSQRFEVPTATQALRSETGATSVLPESGSTTPVIPKWILQFERDVKAGKAPELKKWQYDVLRTQHPELLKRYEKIDQATKEKIRQSAKESMAPSPNPASMTAPGDLPSMRMPAYMNPSPLPIPVSVPLTPSYSYADSVPSAATPLESSVYMTMILVGGIIFGALLIATFGF